MAEAEKLESAVEQERVRIEQLQATIDELKEVRAMIYTELKGIFSHFLTGNKQLLCLYLPLSFLPSVNFKYIASQIAFVIL